MRLTPFYKKIRRFSRARQIKAKWAHVVVNIQIRYIEKVTLVLQSDHKVKQFSPANHFTRWEDNPPDRQNNPHLNGVFIRHRCIASTSTYCEKCAASRSYSRFRASGPWISGT